MSYEHFIVENSLLSLKYLEKLSNVTKNKYTYYLYREVKFKLP